MPISSPERAALEHGDLDDLLPPSAAAAANNGGGAPPMKLDWSSPLELAADAGYRICSAVSYVYAYAVYSYHHRRTEFVLGGVLLGCSALALSGWLGGPSSSSRGGGRGGYHNPTILHDWSAAESAFDLKLGGIDHWCLRGGDDACRCEDPLVPSARSEAKSWGSAHGRNKQAAADAVQRILAAQTAAAPATGPSLPWSSGPYDNEGVGDDGLAWFEDGYQDDWAGYTEDFENYNNNNRNRHRRTAAAATQLDVVFLGDSITEQRVGKFYGKDNKTLKSNAKVFRNNYSRENGAKYEGLALGIAGDTAPNLLWRIMHGEMPPDLNPRIWWIGVGTNDLGATQCSEEVTLLGILRVVEEILNRKPDARIVINSILPMSQEKSGILEVTGRKGRTTGRNKRKGPATTVFWPSIKAVNKQLQKFADKHKSVKFFDATDIFTERVGNRLVIDHALIEDGVHPTAAGYKAWDREIIKRIDTILAKDDDAKTAAAAAADYEAQKQQADMDKAAAGDITDDNYDSFDEFSGGYTYDDTMMDDLYFAAQYEEGDDDWLYAGQDTDDWR
jgi:lysophospholipase L1-like esterase